MSDQKVIPFRRRPPSLAQLTIYRHITRKWHPEMRRAIFPDHFSRDESPRSK